MNSLYPFPYYSHLIRHLLHHTLSVDELDQVMTNRGWMYTFDLWLTVLNPQHSMDLIHHVCKHLPLLSTDMYIDAIGMNSLNGCKVLWLLNVPLDVHHIRGLLLHRSVNLGVLKWWFTTLYEEREWVEPPLIGREVYEQTIQHLTSPEVMVHLQKTLMKSLRRFECHDVLWLCCKYERPWVALAWLQHYPAYLLSKEGRHDFVEACLYLMMLPELSVYHLLLAQLFTRCEVPYEVLQTANKLRTHPNAITELFLARYTAQKWSDVVGYHVRRVRDWVLGV